MTDHPESRSGRWYKPAIITSWIRDGCGVNRAPPPLPPTPALPRSPVRRRRQHVALSRLRYSSD